jgi:hypothetical protein
MTICRYSAIVLAFSLGSAIHAYAEQPVVLPDPRSVFDVDLPAGCNLSDHSGPDFSVFYVDCNGTTYAGIYVGNAADQSVPRSKLIETGYGFPSEIQVWSNEIPSDQEKAEKIAASVKLRPRK